MLKPQLLKKDDYVKTTLFFKNDNDVKTTMIKRK